MLLSLYDSLSAIYLAKDRVQHEWIKHINVMYHFLCKKEWFEVCKIGTMENLADMFNTKPIPRSKWVYYLDLLNVDCWWQSSDDTDLEENSNQGEYLLTHALFLFCLLKVV